MKTHGMYAVAMARMLAAMSKAAPRQKVAGRWSGLIRREHFGNNPTDWSRATGDREAARRKRQMRLGLLSFHPMAVKTVAERAESGRAQA